MIPLGILLALAGPPNVVLVTFDSLRADYLHAYGRAGIETPATDRLAREGVVVEDATVQAPETKPSLVSILTGRHPWEHGVRDDFTPRVGDGMETLATLLHGRGYKTAAFVGSYVLASDFGLNRGFDLYDEPFSDAPHGFERYRHRERPAWRIVEKALDWLNHAGPGPLFLWAHLDDLHFPYTTHAPFAEKYKDQPYAGQVAYADAQLGRLLDFFDKQGLRGRTLFVLTSDHGEGLGEHGEDEHRFFLYDSTLRVPLILVQPGLLPAGTRVRGQFRSVDILPTVLALIGAPAVATSGASRAAELRSGRRLPDNESPSEALFGALHYGYAPVRALRGERWKLIDAPRPELYDLRADPQEATNLIEARPAVAAAMRDRLRAHDGDPRGTAGRLPSTADPAMAETMTVLNTIGAPTLAAGAASGADPKDKTLEIRQFRNDAIEAQQLARSAQPGPALA